MPPTVAAAFDALLADLRLTSAQQAIARGRIAHLRSLFTDYAVSRQPWAIGSYGRSTIIRRERDIDVMVALRADPYWGRYRLDSSKFLGNLRDNLNKAYPNTTVSRRRVAICMALREGLGVDLVPVLPVTEVPVLTFLGWPLLRTRADGFYMPDGEGGWQKTNPPYHDELMRADDERLGRKLKPLVRLMKAWNLAKYGRLGSFHLEMMVRHVWSKAKAIPPLPIAMAQTLDGAARLAGREFRDPWSDGGRLDAYLDADRREKAVRSLRGDAARAREALAHEAAGNVPAAFERWSVVFGHDFPVYG